MNAKMAKEVQRIRDKVNDLQSAQSNLSEIVGDLTTQNELLRRDLNQEREKRADELEKIELRLRLQMSEELRRLPPRDGN